MTVLKKINDDLIVDDMVYRPSFTKLELDEDYYLKLKNGKIEVQKFIGGFVLRNDDEIAEVLGKVPSYEEWDKLNNTCHELEKETACLTVDIVKLKELLKECRGYIEYVGYLGADVILGKIDKALKSINTTDGVKGVG